MKCELSEICTYVKEKTKVSGLTKHTYISTENMICNKGGIVDASSLPAVSQISAFIDGDVLISNIRPYFRKIWFATYSGGCSNDVLVLRAKKGIVPQFLYYVLADNAFFDYATSTCKGTKMPRGDKDAIMKYKVPKISEDKQRKVVKILGSIDEKIKLNQLINDNLQQQAQAVFRESFINSAERPQWLTGTFSNLIESTLGGDWGKESPTGNNTEMVYCIRGTDIPEVKVGNKGKMPTRFIIPKNYVTKHLMDGDIVVEISGGSPTQSTGRAVVISQSLLNRYNKGMVCTNFCRAIKPKTGYSMFIYYYWQYLYDQNIFFSYENGTTGIKNLDLMGFLSTEEIVLPSEDKIMEFDTFCQTIFNKIFANGKENEYLSSLRDTLLPKLMSGELEVSDIDF